MSAGSLHVELLRFTHHPDEIAAIGAKLCYSPVDIKTHKEGKLTCGRVKEVREKYENRS